jgi:hypothetical protein
VFPDPNKRQGKILHGLDPSLVSAVGVKTT